MKIVYIGNYRDKTGWGAAAEANILAMNSVGLNVVPRPISFGGNGEAHPIIQQLEEQSCSNADVIIQHALPQYYYANKKVKNIGFYCVETDDFYASGWRKYINQMDQAWVMSEHNYNASIISGVQTRVKVVPYSIDVNKFDLNNKTAQIDELKNTFNFCFVGEWNHRKNIESLLRAFYSEFHRSEPVNLFIKLSSNMPSEQCMAEFNKLNEHVKSGLKLNKYKNISVVCGKMDHQHYLSILNQCHVFVCPSRGEACCIPMIEAQAMGLSVLVTSNTGMDDYIISGYSIPSKEDICFGMQSTLPEIQTGYEYWKSIDTISLKISMRSMYECGIEKEEASKKTKEQYNYESVGNKIKEILTWI